MTITLPFPALTTDDAATIFREALAAYDASVRETLALLDSDASPSEVHEAQARSEALALDVQSANVDRIFALDSLIKARTV